MGIQEDLNSSISIPAAFWATARKHPAKCAFSQAIDLSDAAQSLNQPQSIREFTYSKIESQVLAVQFQLNQRGVKKGDRLAIISGTRPEWLISDMGILSCGGLTVSVYQSLKPEELAYILFDSGARIVFAENQEQLDKLAETHGVEFEFPATEDRPAIRSKIEIAEIITFEQVLIPANLEIKVSSFESFIAAKPEGSVRQPEISLTRDDIATLVYTSGTTGPPKGVVQTHGNHLSNVRQAFESELVNETSSVFLPLPLAHSFAKLMGYIGMLTTVELKFPAIVDHKSSKIVPQALMRDMRECSAQINPLVPRFLEKMKDSILLKSRGKNLGSKLLAITIATAEARLCARKLGKSSTVLNSLIWQLTGFVRRKIRVQLFGPNFLYCISGGAKLGNHVAEFFWAMELPVLEGYGLTETCVATNIGRIKNNRIGTVGPVLAPDIQMKLAPDGEIIYCGPNIAVGYWNRPTATKQSWDAEGWFHTGDLGQIDADGYLSIVGRKKEIIVTSGGKNIAPNDIEAKLCQTSYISQAVLIGDERKYCVALVTLDRAAAIAWAKRSKQSPDNLHESAGLLAEIWKEVDQVNSHLASYETVKKIKVLPEEFNIDNGLLTPTLKLKRKEIEKRFSAEIESLYGGG